VILVAAHNSDDQMENAKGSACDESAGYGVV
jgi:hypothetical protein